VISLDYCADQFVLGLADRAQILAVSPDARRPFSALREAAEGVRQVRPSLESVLALRPDLVVRSYGGTPDVAARLQALGVPVVQLGWPQDVADVAAELTRVAVALGNPEAGTLAVAALPAPASGDPVPALYLSSGGATAGEGTLIAAMMTHAGLAPAGGHGWQRRGLESLLAEPPAALVYADFGDATRPWTAAGHPVASRVLAGVPAVAVPGAWVGCTALHTGAAITAMARLRAEVAP
jgi:iron complex transport system substrate-binding protein